MAGPLPETRLVIPDPADYGGAAPDSGTGYWSGDAETAVTAGHLGLVLLVAAGVVIAAIVAARLAHAAGLPALLVFLGLGLVLGEAGVGVRFDNAELAEVLGLGALVLILAEGGLTTNWAHARAAAPGALLLATVGVAVSVLVVAGVTRGLLGFSWRDSLLLGAILAPTDAAAVFSVLRKLPLPPKLAGMLEGESGLNDPPSVLAVTLLSQAGPHPLHPALLAAEVAWQLAGGAAIGLAAGILGALALRRVALPASGLYPIAVLAVIVASYGAASQARASGFLAVYVSAVVLGNARLPHGPATRGFAEGIGWLAQIGLFVMLGLLASPARLPAQELPPGKYTVILEPAAVLDAVGFMFWDFGGSALLDQRSFLNDRIGTQLFGENITVWDDVYHPLQTGVPFDGEGMRRHRLKLIDKGVVQRVTYARSSAHRMQQSRHGCRRLATCSPPDMALRCPTKSAKRRSTSCSKDLRRPGANRRADDR